jgi:hypothetical protein
VLNDFEKQGVRWPRLPATQELARAKEGMLFARSRVVFYLAGKQLDAIIFLLCYAAEITILHTL